MKPKNKGLSGYIATSLLLVTVLLLFQSGSNAQQEPCPVKLPDTEAFNKPVLMDADFIRVGISDDAMTELEYPSATISATGPYNITGKSTGKLIFCGLSGQTVQFSRNDNGFFLFVTGSGRIGPFDEVINVKPVSDETRLKITSVTRKGIIPSYRGVFEITPGYSGANRFTIVNVLPLQDYLKAVVPNELPYSYGYEAVKAQAVAARNYAIRPREKPWPQFDICDSQYCQAYYGSNTEHPQTSRAIQETQGLVALYNGEPILALYSSSNGGYAERYENVFSDSKTNMFPGTPLEYLRGGSDSDEFQDLSSEEKARDFYTSKTAGSFDILSPSYRWQKEWKREDLEIIINKNLAEVSADKLTKPFVKPYFPKNSSIGQLQNLKVLERGVSGKIMKLEIIASKGTWVLEKEFVIRKVLRYQGRFLPSANVLLDMAYDKNGNLVSVKATGGGMGHGVGMSQLGASYLSKHGKKFMDILQHYYQGVAIGTIPIVARNNQGMKTEFYTSKTEGILYIKSSDQDIVSLELNEKRLEIRPDEQGGSLTAVDAYLNNGSLNILKLLPSENSLKITKAWIEIFPKTDQRQNFKTVISERR